MTELEKLQAECMECRGCSLAEVRQQVVFGEGNPNAEVMFIGEAPGEREDIEGRPFVGRSGKLLDELLAMVGLDRTRVYIASIIKCRPPKNRDPLSVEQDACISWLRAQVKAIQPRLIVCLGRVAAQRLIRDDFKIMKERGQWIEKNGYQMMATLHPAAILRNPNNRPIAFADFEAVRKALEG